MAYAERKPTTANSILNPSETSRHQYPTNRSTNYRNQSSGPYQPSEIPATDIQRYPRHYTSPIEPRTTPNLVNNTEIGKIPNLLIAYMK
ncbi:hypothetical protein OnM2_011027 [Erysiphe neolycopersici]|uniref:Uncharacterized protein n=1 Tax=Erysiphe neolycopersici TaxID=212602 RepID=A0A420I6B7_9PEZI|nr:hypothetical protein OnM2_011027 [Erysiphe neolycopersici]